MCADVQCGSQAKTGACCTLAGCADGLEEAACLGIGGAYLGDGIVCTPDDCLQETPEACCINSQGWADCVPLTATQCAQQDGNPVSGQQCADVECFMGACCIMDPATGMSCEDGWLADMCQFMPGTQYYGGAACVDDPCK